MWCAMLARLSSYGPPSTDGGPKQNKNMSVLHMDCPHQSGFRIYRVKLPDAELADLCQNPSSQPRQGRAIVPTLTTGSWRIFSFQEKRYVRGKELLLLHSVPVCMCVAELLGSPRISVEHLSHRAQCRLAGNSMHVACIGAVS